MSDDRREFACRVCGDPAIDHRFCTPCGDDELARAQMAADLAVVRGRLKHSRMSSAEADHLRGEERKLNAVLRHLDGVRRRRIDGRNAERAQAPPPPDRDPFEEPGETLSGIRLALGVLHRAIEREVLGEGPHPAFEPGAAAPTPGRVVEIARPPGPTRRLALIEAARGSRRRLDWLREERLVDELLPRPVAEPQPVARPRAPDPPERPPAVVETVPPLSAENPFPDIEW